MGPGALCELLQPQLSFYTVLFFHGEYNFAFLAPFLSEIRAWGALNMLKAFSVYGVSGFFFFLCIYCIFRFFCVSVVCMLLL